MQIKAAIARGADNNFRSICTADFRDHGSGK